jgi:hypothetical protein
MCGNNSASGPSPGDLFSQGEVRVGLARNGIPIRRPGRPGSG